MRIKLVSPRSVKNPSNAFRPTLSEIDQMEPIDGKKKKRDRFKKKMATENKKEKKYFDDVKKNFQFFFVQKYKIVVRAKNSKLFLTIGTWINSSLKLVGAVQQK